MIMSTSTRHANKSKQVLATPILSDYEEVTEDQQQNIASDDELGGIFCDGSDSISFFYDPNKYGLELQESDLYSIL
ncbi:hypothetical protein HN51_013467 [Arachis hypogaea]